jgi:hypothetical protein
MIVRHDRHSRSPDDVEDCQVRRTVKPLHFGAPRFTEPGNDGCRVGDDADTNSRIYLWLRSARTAVPQLAIKRSRSNMGRPSSIWRYATAPTARAAASEAVTLLVKLIRIREQGLGK